MLVYGQPQTLNKISYQSVGDNNPNCLQLIDLKFSYMFNLDDDIIW